MGTNKFIVFKIGDCPMALPLNDVLKVVNYPSETSGGLRDLGLVQLGKHTIRVLDFHRYLTPKTLASIGDRKSFLVITRTPEGELCGIVVDEPPNLIELQSEMIRSLPTSESHSGLLQMVSHAAVLSDEDTTTTIFLLDIKRILNPAI